MSGESVTSAPSAEPPAASTDIVLGLSEAEAQRRRAAGQGNLAPLRSSRTYGRILRDNVFNFINNVLFTLGAILVILGKYLDALIAVGVIALNTIVNLVQEVRAKVLLDRIAILTRPRATVIRDGRRREIDPDEIVLGDLLVLRAGDQVVVDGPMVGTGHMEMDESLLTGESDLVPKHPGDQLLSGSFCVTGGGLYVAEKVATDTYVFKLTAGAQAFRRVLTPLQTRIYIIIRSLLLIALSFEILVIIKAFLDDIPFSETVRLSTVIVALIPNGLVLSIALAYALGAVRMAGKGALVQQGNAIESMSNVDVLCTDKTGTLTTNTIRFHDLEPFGGERKEVEKLLGEFAAGGSEGNRTSDAIKSAFSARRRPVAEEAVFSSVRKWSAISFADDDPPRTYVLGAPEVLADAVDLEGAGREGHPAAIMDERFAEWSAQGLRVLLFAVAPAAGPLYQRDADGRPVGEPRLPDGLVPLALVSLSDELRPKVQETLADLAAAGVELKIISGDHPQTVAALARQAGFHGELHVLSGRDIAAMDDDELRRAVGQANIFGRVTPQQKERLVAALRENGHYVAMIGDGVNDVVSLKKANVGIAMQGGSQAARAVADMILLKDSFAALPWAFREGQRIWNGMQDILRIFMVRILSMAFLIAAIGFLGGFPFQLRQSSLLAFFSAGIPAIALATFAKPGKADRSRVLYDLMRFVMPATIVMCFLAIGLFAGYVLTAGVPSSEFDPGAIAAAVGQTLFRAQTVVTTFLIFCALLLLPMTVPPTRLWVGGANLRRDWKMTVLAVLLFAGYMAVLLSPLGRQSFDLAKLSAPDLLLAGGSAVLWSALTLWSWRHQIFERFLGLPAEAPGGAPEVPPKVSRRKRREHTEDVAPPDRPATVASPTTAAGPAAPAGTNGASSAGAAQLTAEASTAPSAASTAGKWTRLEPPPTWQPLEGTEPPDAGAPAADGETNPEGSSSSATSGAYTPGR